MPNKDWMDALSKLFPDEMAETRRRVRKEVERSIKAAKFLVAAQVCFVLAMAEVEPEDIDPGFRQRADFPARAAARPKGRNNLGILTA